MRHLVIKNFGPIRNADLQLGQVNVLIGMQSSGKSCVLKTACYCTWVEKRLELSQKVNGFGNGSAFIDIMTSYFKWQDTSIRIPTSNMKPDMSSSHTAIQKRSLR